MDTYYIVLSANDDAECVVVLPVKAETLKGAEKFAQELAENLPSFWAYATETPVE